jgi:hypothetical protein
MTATDTGTKINLCTGTKVSLVSNLTSGSNRSLRSLGRAKARPLTKRYALYEITG